MSLKELDQLFVTLTKLGKPAEALKVKLLDKYASSPLGEEQTIDLDKQLEEEFFGEPLGTESIGDEDTILKEYPYQDFDLDEINDEPVSLDDMILSFLWTTYKACGYSEGNGTIVTTKEIRSIVEEAKNFDSNLQRVGKDIILEERNPMTIKQFQMIIRNCLSEFTSKVNISTPNIQECVIDFLLAPYEQYQDYIYDNFAPEIRENKLEVARQKADKYDPYYDPRYNRPKY